MGEDILKRLGDILKDDHNAFTRATAIAAQAEIMRLEERSKGLRRERDALRAELDAANDMKRRMTDACEEANRVAEQYRAELAAATARLENALNEGAKRRAERDTLRALLEDAREAIISDVPISPVVARIDAALNKGGE